MRRAFVLGLDFGLPLPVRLSATAARMRSFKAASSTLSPSWMSDATTEFLQQNGDPYTRIARDEPGGVAIDFGVYGVPETYLVDKSGTVRWRWAGGMSDDVVQQSLAPLLRNLG